jgi:prepilin-type N-terminal cleavage/methylation domain-containing protein
MKRKKGITLVELLVALTISSVLILMVGFLSQIAVSSHVQLKNEGDVYSDLFYGLSRLSFLARQASALGEDTWPYPPWVSKMLIVDNSAFGLYQPAGQKIDFVFVPDKNNRAVRDPLLTQADEMSFTVAQNGKSVVINILGKKQTQEGKQESFSISNFVVTRRNDA